MPYRKRKRYAKKKRGSYRRKKAVIRKSPMPTKFVTKMRYCERFTVDPTTGGLAAAYVFRANGLYDPNMTGTGHQPRGFDQLMAMYDHFVVLGSKITVTFNLWNTEAYNCVVGICLKDQATTQADANNYLEAGDNSYRAISTKTGQATITKTFNNKFLGRSSPLSDPQLKGSTTADPTELAFFHVWGSPAVGTSNPSAIDCVCQIDYIVALIEPKTPVQS